MSNLDDLIRNRAVSYLELADYVAKYIHDQSIGLKESLLLRMKSVATGAVMEVAFVDGAFGIYLWIQNEFQLNENYSRVLRADWEFNVFDMMTVELTLLTGGCSNSVRQKKVVICGKELLLKSPSGKRNDCGIDCLRWIKKITESNIKLRQAVGEPAKTQLSPSKLRQIAANCGIDLKVITMSSTREELEQHGSKVLLKNNHYSLIERTEYIQAAVRGPRDCERGILFYDLETRPYAKVAVTKTGQDVYRQRETIIAIRYKPPRHKGWYDKIFTSTRESFAGEQFLAWLRDSEIDYNCYAHNGSRFDIYFLLSYTDSDRLFVSPKKSGGQTNLNMVLRGLSVISYKYYGHEFKDTCCFLTKSLKQLSDDFKPKHKKIHEDTELCFYKPELDYWEFMNLQVTEPGFWDRYLNYCLFDVISLAEIFMMFETEVDNIFEEVSMYIHKPHNFLKSKQCTVRQTLTIGSLAKKVFTNTADSKALKRVEEFIDTDPSFVYSYLKAFVRGGVSFVQYPGKHLGNIALYDIKSMYPACMLDMNVPCGKASYFTEDVKEKYLLGCHGYYKLKKLAFQKKCFRPIAYKGVEGYPRVEGAAESLVWKTDTYENMNIDFEMLQYLDKNYKITEMVFESCLISESHIDTKLLFAPYVNVLYAKKQAQDDLPKSERNNALRETVKLFLNSLSGKMVEDPLSHEDFAYNSDPTVKDRDFLNGVHVKKVAREKLNKLFTLGLSIYSFSKRLLWEYIRCLPDKEDGVIASETDSIYIAESSMKQFELNIQNKPKTAEFSCFGLGDVKLGNFAHEETSSRPSYFLGKKQYCFGGDKLKFKGLSVRRITPEGNFEQVLTEDVFQELYEKGTVEVEQSFLKRKFNSRYIDDDIHITGYNDSKKFKKSYHFAEYNL